MMCITNGDIELILEGNMKDKSKWFCSRDVFPEEERSIIVKFNANGIILHGVGEFYIIDDGAQIIHLDSVDDPEKDGSYSYTITRMHFFCDIDENGKIVHFVYWRYLDE